MRFTAAIISALALASIGVQAAPAPQDASAERVDTQSWNCQCPPPPPPCTKYAVFYDWDLNIGDVGVSQSKDDEGCAKDSSTWNPKSDATVSYNGFCYHKTYEKAKSGNHYWNHGRKLIVPGTCDELKKGDYGKPNDKKKFKDEMFKPGVCKDICIPKKW